MLYLTTTVGVRTGDGVVKSFNSKGDFWFPESPDKKVSGWIEFEPGQGAQLHLIGHLLRSASRRDGANISRIVGSCSAGGVTLDNCFQTRSMFGSSGPGEQSFRVGVVLVGSHIFEDGEEITFDRLGVGLRHLLWWTSRDGLDEHYGVTDSGETVYEHSMTRLPTLTAVVEPGVTLRIEHRTGFEGRRDARSLTQNEGVQFDLDADAPLAEITSYATMVQDLVSIATHRIAEFDDFVLSRSDFEFDEDDARTGRGWVDLYVEWIARETSDKAPGEIAIPFAEIGGVEGIAVWLRKAKALRPLISRVMATRYSKMYADDRFFNRAAALEGLHREIIRKDVNFATRLKELAAKAGDPFTRLVGDVPKWIMRVKAERNDHAHQLGNAANSTGATRYFLAESAYWLFVMCLFRECGYSTGVFDAIEKCAEFGWLQGRLASL
jgi:hypothetical protein